MLDADAWLQAMRSEMDSIHENHTWESAKPASTPLPKTIRLSNKDSPATKEERKLNGKIRYTSAIERSCTQWWRPDLILHMP